MRSSIYNLFLPTSKEGEFILYNTLNGCVSLVDAEARDAILHSPDESLDDETKQNLIGQGILVDDHVDERAIFRVRRNLTKYGPSPRTHFTILTTYLCNLACPYCYEKTFELPPKSMTEKTTSLVIGFIKNTMLERSYQKLMIYFYGGEPMVNTHAGLRILQTLDPWLKDHAARSETLILTNGTLLKRDVVSELLNHNVAFQITLDGPKHIHDKRRFYKNGKGSYDDIMKGLNTLKGLKAPFQIRVNVDKENLPYVDELLDELKERFGQGIRLRYFLTLQCLESCFTHNPICLIGKETSVLPKLWESALTRGFDLRVKPLLNYMNCTQLTSHSYVIDPLGDVYRCWALFGPPHRIGTINEMGKLEIDYPYYELMSHDPLEIDECRECKFLPTCGGGCPSMSFDQYGTYHKAYCQEDKYVINERIRLELKRNKVLSTEESILC